MPSKPETNFYTSIHRYLPVAVYRMKNHNDYIGGIPDVWYSGARNDLWVEYKYVPISSPRSMVKADLSAKQLHWITCRRAEGRNVWVIIGYKRGGVIYTDLDDIRNGILPDDFLARTLSRKAIAEQIEDFCGQKEAPTGRRGNGE